MILDKLNESILNEASNFDVVDKYLSLLKNNLPRLIIDLKKLEPRLKATNVSQKRKKLLADIDEAQQSLENDLLLPGSAAETIRNSLQKFVNLFSQTQPSNDIKPLDVNALPTLIKLSKNISKDERAYKRNVARQLDKLKVWDKDPAEAKKAYTKDNSEDVENLKRFIQSLPEEVNKFVEIIITNDILKNYDKNIVDGFVKILKDIYELLNNKSLNIKEGDNISYNKIKKLNGELSKLDGLLSQLRKSQIIKDIKAAQEEKAQEEKAREEKEAAEKKTREDKDILNSAADWQKKLDAILAGSDNMAIDDFWESYYNSFNENTLIVKILGAAFQEEIKKFGFYEKSNPFLYYVKNFIIPNKMIVSESKYNKIHNAYINNKLDKKSLFGLDYVENNISHNIIWSSAIMKNSTYQQLEQYIDAQASLDYNMYTFKEYVGDNTSEAFIIDMFFFEPGNLSTKTRGAWNGEAKDPAAVKQELGTIVAQKNQNKTIDTKSFAYWVESKNLDKKACAAFILQRIDDINVVNTLTKEYSLENITYNKSTADRLRDYFKNYKINGSKDCENLIKNLFAVETKEK